MPFTIDSDCGTFTYHYTWNGDSIEPVRTVYNLGEGGDDWGEEEEAA